MIHSTELRIGNLVARKLPNGHKGVYSVESIAANDICLGNFGGITSQEKDLFPIGLSDYWLRKSGFIFGSSMPGIYDYSFYRHPAWSDFFALHRYKIDEERSLYRLAFTKGAECYTADREGYFESVHQLQNLFFILTGKELTIKDA